MSSRPNLILIMTDSQPTRMLGAYGHPEAKTPHLDALAAGGVRFERAFTTSPLCTPARSALFSGLHAQVNGAWSNNLAPAKNVPLMGEIFQRLGYFTGYSGKWHLEGAGYFGDGHADDGFPQQWWFDGKNYAEEIGPELFEAYIKGERPEEFPHEKVWGHRVADRAIDFLRHAAEQDRPFLLVVSFDEPHAPFVTPPGYRERFTEPPEPPLNFHASLADKPLLQRRQAEKKAEREWPEYWEENLRAFYACNHFVDEEIGRVVDAVRELSGEDTYIFYTSDHGDMAGSHGLVGKGPMMYQETVRIPFLMSGPGIAPGVCDSIVTHLDVMPTFLELAGCQPPEMLQGQSLTPLLQGGAREAAALISFHRFGVNHDGWGGFYPIRAWTDTRYKLVINLLDTDEFYDLEADPGETHNLIGSPEHSVVRDRMHDEMLEELNRIRDPFRSVAWRNRPWRDHSPLEYGGQRRPRPEIFSFQHPGIEADGKLGRKTAEPG